MRSRWPIPLGWLCLYNLIAFAGLPALAIAAPPSLPIAPPPQPGGTDGRAHFPTLSLPVLLDRVVSSSPDLQARAADVAAAAERPAQGGALDDPMLMVELWQVPLSTAHIPLMFTLRQPITWPGKLAARAAVLRHDRTRAQADVDRGRRELRLAATRGYYDYRLAVRSLDVLRAARALSASHIAAVDVRYRVGRAELAELLAAQETQATLDNAMLDIERERDVAAAALNVLCGQPVDQPLGTPVTPPTASSPLPLAQLIDLALTRRAELHAIDAQIAQAGDRARAARHEHAPDLAVSASYMTMVRGGDPNEQTFTVGLQTSLPSWSLARSGAALRESHHQVRSLRAQRQQAERDIAGQVRTALLRLETADRHVRFHSDTLLPLSERALRAAQAGYQSGRAPLSLLLDATRRLTEHQLDAERYQAELGQRQAELEAACGGPTATTGAP